MSSGKPLRGVVVYDIELEGGVAIAAAFDEILKEYASDFESYLKKSHPKLASVVKFTQKKAAVPLQERRGATGELDQIVFRGTRGAYTPSKEVVTVSVEKVDTDNERVLIRTVGSKGAQGLFWYPFAKIPPRTREGIISAWVLGDEKPRSFTITSTTFERYALPA